MTAASGKRDDKFHAEYLPPPPPAPGKIVVWAPMDSKGHPICPDLHLTPAQAEQLMDALNGALSVYLEQLPE